MAGFSERTIENAKGNRSSLFRGSCLLSGESSSLGFLPALPRHIVFFPPFVAVRRLFGSPFFPGALSRRRSARRSNQRRNETRIGNRRRFRDATEETPRTFYPELGKSLSSRANDTSRPEFVFPTEYHQSSFFVHCILLTPCCTTLTKNIQDQSLESLGSSTSSR